MEFNKVTVTSACKACKNPLKHEDQVVVAKAANFYHLKCYKSKNWFFKMFHPIIGYIIWYDNKILMDDLKKVLLDCVLEHVAVNQMIEKGCPESDKVDTDVDDDTESKSILKGNLSVLMSEVNEMKTQINYFADEKENDEKIIMLLQLELGRYKKEVKELKWLLDYRKYNKNYKETTI